MDPRHEWLLDDVWTFEAARTFVLIWKKLLENRFVIDY